MKVLIKRFDKSIDLPNYMTQGSAAFDLSARIDIKIKAKSTGYIPLNIALKIPKGYWVLLSARSSLHKKGLMLANGIGVGDSDYCGDNDEYLAAVYNFTDKDVTISKATRVAQMMILKRERVQFEEVGELEEEDRGGIGSTGD